jgi:FKBP-type peptidyl-prolyl cis-trans isomerase FkpA
MRSFVRVLALATLPLVAACGSSTTSPSIVTSSGTFTITDVRVGTGADATVGRSLTVNYSGWLYDTSKTEGKGTQFDSNTGRGPFAFTLGGNVIAGWNQGIVGMKVGGLRRLIIPPNLGYGAGGSGPIPPNATLVFDVELLSVQ